MDRKQKMIALGAGVAAAMVLLLSLGAVMLFGSCGADEPRQTDPASTAEQGCAPSSHPQETEQTQPPETEQTQPAQTEPTEPTAQETVFREVNESVTAKIETNLRSIPSQDADSTVLCTLQNGEWITRTGISDSGWSRLERDGVVYYAVSSYLTDDPNYVPPSAKEDDDGIQTVFTAVEDRVTAKELVNLRSIPSVTRADSVVVAQLVKGEWITRTGINTDVGWSRVEYNGQTLYCITSYLQTEEEEQPEETQPEETTAPTS